jgi:2-keto-4-pentenoate hydratase
MTSEAQRNLAASLSAAYQTREPIDPPSKEPGGLSVEDAYEVQRLQVEEWVGSGRVVRGHKVGLTSVAMQAMMGVDQPDYGHLMDDMFYPEGSPVPLGTFLQPRVEPEVALVLGRSLAGPGVTVVDALRAVDLVLPALELIDSRVRDWQIGLADTIADNASSGGVVLGSRALQPDSVDLRLIGVNLYRNGSLEATGAGGAALGSPVVALAWLANTLGSLGVVLEEGEVVLPGSCTKALTVAPGDVVTANFGGLGSVTAVFGRE